MEEISVGTVKQHKKRIRRTAIEVIMDSIRLSGLVSKRIASVCVLILIVLLLLTGCAKRQPPPPQVTFRVYTETFTNNGLPFYMLFRMVDTQVFLTETYGDVAGKVFVQPPDISILASQSIVPGQHMKINVVKPENSAIGIYCLFTEPGDQWKLRIVPPLYDNYKVKLEENSIREVEMMSDQKKGLLQRLFSKDES